MARNAEAYPALRYEPQGGRQADVTVVTYGGMTGAAEAAMQDLLEDEELSFDYLVLTQLWPLDVYGIVESVRTTKRLVVVEENVSEYGVASSVIAAVAQALACWVRQPRRRRQAGAASGGSAPRREGPALRLRGRSRRGRDPLSVRL